MNVWLVEVGDWGDTHVRGVYASEKAAIEAAKEYAENRAHPETALVTMYRVEGLCADDEAPAEKTPRSSVCVRHSWKARR